MPKASAGEFTVDYIDAGSGPAVLLVPSTASGNRQWRALIEAASGRYRFIASNMFGYGETSPWPATRRQTLADQASLVLALARGADGPIALVGHSFGGSVAMQAALALGDSVRGLALFEPNPFHLLPASGDHDGHAEGRRIRDIVKRYGAAGDWVGVAQRFADYWVGDGAWAAMPENRRSAFAAAIHPNFHEWDALYGDSDDDPVPAFDLPQLQRLDCPVLVVRSENPRPGIAAIDALLRRSCPHWSFESVPAGGHMAPLTRPDLVNPILLDFLDRTR
jgi:pimeloyl-ACP methyl ester carboxylesterase